ncbi:hypothetical protein EDC04DRAFT_2588662, partial [Pisolithus marmoratus]
VSDRGLVECLKDGIGYYHEAMDKQDNHIVEWLFQSGTIQILLICIHPAWSLPVTSHMVIIMGIQYYKGKEHCYIDYPMIDFLGHVCQPTEDKQSQCMCQQTHKDFYKKFIAEGLPTESHLPTNFHNYFLTEIAVKTIENKHNAMVMGSPCLFTDSCLRYAHMDIFLPPIHVKPELL